MFNTDFKTCVQICITNLIDTNIIKSFTQNKNIIYVKNKLWEELSFDEFKKLVDIVQRNLIFLFSEWSKSLTENQIYGSNNMKYLKNQQKIFGGNNRIKDIKSIYSELYKSLKEIINDLVKLDISF